MSCTFEFVLSYVQVGKSNIRVSKSLSISKVYVRESKSYVRIFIHLQHSNPDVQRTPGTYGY